MFVGRNGAYEQRTIINEQHLSMQINRHNYEQFFLLYVDKELSATDIKAVDVFVKENPDLQIELAMLQQTVVKADDIVLEKKDWLYMEEELTALQENLLLYADDELTTPDKKSVEALLTNNKAALAEWNILKLTKLQPDMAVVFADKKSLYKKEGGGVVGFKWWRAAAAAVLLGFAFWAGVSVYKNNSKTTSGSTELVNNKKPQSQQTKTNVPVKNTTTIAKEKSRLENITSTSTQTKNNAVVIEKIKPALEKNKDPENNAAATEIVVDKNKNDKKRGNDLPKSYLENINNRESNKTIVAGVIPENDKSSRVSGNNTAVIKTNPTKNITSTFIAGGNNNKTDQNAIAVQVVNNKTTDGENNNRYLNVDDDKEKRTTLGAFIRKAKRVIERTTSVKTGEGIKIAGFEIALK